MKGFTSLAHAALKVRDLERSMEFYVNKLGFAEMLRLHRPDGSVWLVYLRVTDDQYIELFPGAAQDRAPGWDANGVNHICLGVDDIDSVIAQIEAAGIALTAQKKLGADNNYQAWIEDPDGNRIELMQIMPDALQLEAVRRIKAQTRATA